MKCEICSKKFDNVKKLLRHVRDYHDLSSNEYYDMYHKKENEGICPICGELTKYISFTKGYHKTCSHSCHTILQNSSYSTEEINLINQKRKNTRNNKDLTEYKNLQRELQSSRWNSYSPEERELLAEKQQEGLKNMTPENKALFKLNVSKGLKNYYKNIDSDSYNKWRNKISEYNRNKWGSMPEEERRKETIKFVNRIQNRPEEEKKAQYNKTRKTFAKKSKEEKLASYYKGIATKKQNNSLNTSAQEKYCENLLLSKFKDIKTQYRDCRYPFACDFYIPEKDLFIECNFHWTHGDNPFNPKSLIDIQILDEWKEKAKYSNYYKSAINT